MNADLREALLTSNDCTCARDRIEDEDRLPRDLRVTDPGCPDHGEGAAMVLPAEDEIPAPTPALPQVVVDVAAELDRHRDYGRGCRCGNWEYDLEYEEHVALALHRVGLIAYVPRPRHGDDLKAAGL